MFLNYTNLIHESYDRLGIGGGGGGSPSMGFTVPWAFGQPGMGVWEELGEKGKPSGGRGLGIPEPFDSSPLVSSFKTPHPLHAVPDQCVSSDPHPFFLNSCYSPQHQEPSARVQDH